jgi:hypothetical protein
MLKPTVALHLNLVGAVSDRDFALRRRNWRREIGVASHSELLCKADGRLQFNRAGWKANGRIATFVCQKLQIAGELQLRGETSEPQSC